MTHLLRKKQKYLKELPACLRCLQPKGQSLSFSFLTFAPPRSYFFIVSVEGAQIGTHNSRVLLRQGEVRHFFLLPISRFTGRTWSLCCKQHFVAKQIGVFCIFSYVWYIFKTVALVGKVYDKKILEFPVCKHLIAEMRPNFNIQRNINRDKKR